MIFWLDAAICILAVGCAAAFKDFPTRCYFIVLALCQPFLAGSYGSDDYTVLYYGFTATLLMLGLWVSFEVVAESHTRGLVLLCAGLISGSLFVAAIRGAQSVADAETVIEATLAALYGVIVGLSSPNCRQRVPYGSLALAWLLQAAFGFGYTLHVGNRNWYLGNQFVPAFIYIAAFAWIIFYVSLRRENEQLPRRSGQLL